MKIGYSYWGYLGDVKYDKDGNVVSTPDGNAFYSWSIINELQGQGHEVIQVMPDRDAVGYKLRDQPSIFDSWCTFCRLGAYTDMKKMYKEDIDWSTMTREKLFSIWDKNGLNKCKFILHEWRMFIPGRNDDKSIQPDFYIQERLIEYCTKHNIILIIFDLDYKIDVMEFNRLKNMNNKTYLFELGYKWEDVRHAEHVEIPFDFNFINRFSVKDINQCTKNLVYIGNRYERDWCIDKYIPTEISGVRVFGNWNESGRDSKERWPEIEFCSRLQTKDMHYEYSTSLCTILLAKEEYLKHSFMTARILESVFYGCVPLFIEEYGQDCIEKYAGIYANDLTVHSKSDVIDMIYWLKYNESYRKQCISYLRKHLEFMDVRNFVKKIQDVLQKEEERYIV